MTEEQIVRQACENILDFITHGKEEHVLRPEDEVLLLGDHGHLSPLYTRTLANVIDDSQGNAGLVHVKFLPEKRPITSADEVDPEITKLASRVPVVIGTYSNPGAEISALEKEILYKVFVTPAISRKDLGNLRLYVVAARPTISILKTLADSELIRKTDRLTKLVKSYLQKNAGKTMYIYSNDDEHRIPNSLIFRIPTADKIFGDFSEPQEYIMNIPFGEDYFEPEPGTGYGNLVLKKGSYQSLENAIKGRIDIFFSNGKIRDFKDIQGKDLKILGYLKRDLQNLANRHLAEMGIGTYAGSLKIPWKDLLYNHIILEKKSGYHIAYGNSELIGGKHKAPIHVDNLLTYGDVDVDNEHFISNGTLREKVL